MQFGSSSLLPLRRSLAAIAIASIVSCGGGSPPVASTPPDPGGGSSNPDDGNPAPLPPDAAPAISGLVNGSMVSGSSVELRASVPAGTARVEFQVGGTTIATDASEPFVGSWDSFSVQNGDCDLTVRAVDGAGAAKVSPAVRIKVDNHIRNVFVIVFENHDWSSIQGASSAPYINKTLLAEGAHADKYMNVPGLHPSLPNYIWMEAGSNLGIRDDGQPAVHKLTTTQHLTTLLKNAGFTWKAYQEDIPGTDCPLTNVNMYAPKHLPMIYFTDVNGGVNRNSTECISHIRPYSELSRDLETGLVANYNFITPNICNDMHDCSIATGDAWLAREVPKILASRAYRDGGALFVTFDESAGSDVPIGFIALSPLVKKGYSNTVYYTHSSLLRSVQEIFGVAPLLGDAAKAANVSDLFRSFP